MIRIAGLLIASLALSPAATAATAGQTQEELRELRARIAAMQKKLAAAEESRSEASDALRESEQAISEANRELRQLAVQSRESAAKMSGLRKSAEAAGATLQGQQELLGRMLRQQYFQGEPDALRLVLGREDPSALARQLHYLSHVARARAQLVDGLRANLRELERLQAEIAAEAEAIARITREQTAQRARLEQEKRARAGVLSRLARDIQKQQREMRAMQANENRLTRLVDQLTRLVRKPAASGKPAAPGKPRPRNEALPSGSADGSPFAALRGSLALPVRGELGSRFGSPRADGGVTWKGLFIAARAGEDVRAVAGGRVVYADWLRGFGNLLIVDHGDSYMTLYANAEALLKQVGDMIRGGEPVATVGNSGGNAESGLYFEMRHEGRPFDPLQWVRLR
ncbi:MAG: peptidoglycan DD-metalloendopeptidase family protein [Burkholderiales bacterium]|nr:peptidoglycan DD-metalloendopeptidase family protein [Burkholderiales bacterium]